MLDFSSTSIEDYPNDEFNVDLIRDLDLKYEIIYFNNVNNNYESKLLDLLEYRTYNIKPIE